MKKRILFFILILATILRFIWLGSYPNSLYSDEIDQAYNAYSILKTGKDEHGSFLPISLRSFGDWKPPLQTYIMIPSIAVFGINEFSIRFPSALLGVISVYLSYILFCELFPNKKRQALLLSFLIAISPWHILQSRSAMLVLVALVFLQLGVVFLLKSRKSSKFLIPSSIAFVFSIYAYYGMRVIAPLILLFLCLIYFKSIKWVKISFVTAFLISVVLLLPLLISFVKEPDVVFGRAKTVSVFYDQGIKLRQWELITQDGTSGSPFLSLFLHNSPYMFGRDIIRRLFSHFDGSFLTLYGDTSSPFVVPDMGILYMLDYIFILVGVCVLLKKVTPENVVLLVWIFISIIPAALTFMTPSSNRTFNSVFPLLCFSSFGLIYIFKKFSKVKTIFALFVSVIYVFNTIYFFQQYFIQMPIHHASIWNYGYKELSDYLSKVESNYENIYISDVDGMPYIYLLFYQKIDPSIVQKKLVRSYVADRFGFEHVMQFEKYIFDNEFNWKDYKSNMQKHSLYVVPINQSEKDNDFIYEIKYPDGKTAYKIFSS